MSTNIFEQFGEKKRQLREQVQQALAFGWIDQARHDEIMDKLDGDILTIGVIGQMKCGKSTFLNAFVFGEDILPAATTPMTAALSVITYGEQKRIVAEFYTQDEWEEQKLLAQRPLEEVSNNLELSKIKAAKELVGKATMLGGSLPSYLGKTQEDSLDHLIEYVGADGKYIAITKSVTIYYPKEYLKGVEIVDTPGFNDPIVSREERTKAFLSKADVVLMMLYAGRAFDATDRDIIFKNVRQCGTGRVLIGVNKYDLSYANGETEEEICQYVSDEIKKACRECDDQALNDILRATTPIPLSAEMALLSQMSMQHISNNEAYQHAWSRACDVFEISSQQEMYAKSHLEQLGQAVQQVIEKEKEAILFAKPLNALKAAGANIQSQVKQSLLEANELRANLSRPDDELEERSEKLSKLVRRLQKKIGLLETDLDETFRKLVREGEAELEDEVATTCKTMERIVDNKGRFQNAQELIPRLQRETSDLACIKLKRVVQRLSENGRAKVLGCVRAFLGEASELFARHLPDFDERDLLKDVSREICLDIENTSLFEWENEKEQESFWSAAGTFVAILLKGATFGLSSLLENALSHSDAKKEMYEVINDIKSGFDAKPYLETVFTHKTKVIENVQKKFITEMLQPLQEQLEEVRADKTNKEQRLVETNAKIEDLKKKLSTIEEQIQSLAL